MHTLINGLEPPDLNSWNRVVIESRQGRPVRSDSRKVGSGDIFVALSGTRDQGSRYIPEALDRGAAYVVSDNRALTEDRRAVFHPHPPKALGDLARAHFGTDRLNLKVIAVTGTNGKTTTSYMLEHLFSSNGFKTGVLGTVNYRWPEVVLHSRTTTPDCLELHSMLARMDKDEVEIVCLEVSSHALDQERVAGIDIHVAVFSNLSQDHLDYHQDMQDYFLAKRKLFVRGSFNGFQGSVLNTDDPYGRLLADEAEKPLRYGLLEKFTPELAGELLHCGAEGTRLKCRYQDNTWTLKSSLPGRHNALNLLSAQGAALCLGLKPRQFKCLEDMEKVPGRLERVSGPDGRNIFVDYAHTPDALKNVCQALKWLGFKRIVVLFGCGGDRDRGKRPLMGQAVAGYADVVVLTSDNPRSEDPEQIIREIIPGLEDHPCVYIDPDRGQAIRLGLSLLGSGEALLVAGKGHEDYQEINGTKHDFSDVREIKKALLEPPAGNSDKHARKEMNIE